MIDQDYFEPKSVLETTVPADYKGIEKALLDESDAEAVDELYPDIDINLSDLSYNDNFTQRGYFVIFNFKNFNTDSKYHSKPRRGSEVDVARLRQIMKELGFMVKVYDDLTMRETAIKLKRYGEGDMTEYQMFGCAIFSHGEDKGEIFCSSGSMNILDFINPMRKNRTLIGKPKLFFVQACRGHDYMEGWRGRAGAQVTQEAKPFRTPRTWPVDADVLVHYATTEGHLSWRSPTKGSWFISTLCDCLRYVYSEEIHQTLIRVNATVAQDFVSITSNVKSDRKKEMPQIQSQLTKLLYLKPLLSE